MFAPRQVEIPFYKASGRQRGRRFGALAQDFGTTSISFLRNYLVPAPKRVGADLLEFAVSELSEVVSGRKKIKTAAKSVGRQTLRKQLGSGSRKKVQAESFQQNLQNEPVAREEMFLQTFLISNVE